MNLARRLVLVAVLATLAVASVRSSEDVETSPVQDEFDDVENYADYDIEGELEVPPKYDYLPAAPIPLPPPPPPPPAYFPLPVPNYTLPYEQPNYVPEPALYPAPVPAYSAPLPPVAYPAPSYGQNYSAGYGPVNNYSVYEQPAYVPAYQVPPPPPPVYSAPVYSAPAYQAPAYQAPAYSPPAYQAPLAPVYPAPSYQENQIPYVAPVQNYSAPAAYVAPVSNYSAPVYQAAPVVANYSAPMYAPPVKPAYIPPGNYTGQLARVGYSAAELLPFLSPYGYRANHWSLLYYRAAPYRSCPKNVYLNGPSYADIQQAFNFAIQQLNLARGYNIQYLNSTYHSASARHQVFSFLNQVNARMDEEGLLVEFVSQYLADRACLTKWDKQRYLPQLTKFISTSNFPSTHSCNNYYNSQWLISLKHCVNSKYRTFDGFCNNPYHPYWGKSNVCHIRLLSPDYADGISAPRISYNYKFPLPNARAVSAYIHNQVNIDGPYNLMKMQWGQFVNHDITNTALTSYEGLIDCCKNPSIRGCYPIQVPPNDPFYRQYNVTCLNFVRSGVCPLCQLGPRQQMNKNTAFLDISHVYGNTREQAYKLRLFKGGLLRAGTAVNGEMTLPLAGPEEGQCGGVCYQAGDSRVNQHVALTALHQLLFRNHNILAANLAARHPDWNDEYIYQEARRLNIAEYQMITYAEYLPIVFGPILSAYYKLLPAPGATYTYYEPKADPTTWNEYATATCRFGHSQIQNVFGLYAKIYGYGQVSQEPTFSLRDWFLRADFLRDGKFVHLLNGLMSRPASTVDPWVADDVRNYLYRSLKERSGGDLAATNIQRGRDHGIAGYAYYLEYCFNYKVRSWKDLSLFIPYYTLNQIKKLYKHPYDIDLWTGGISERHFPGADIGPTFACINGIQYYHLKFGDRYYFEHANQAGSFNPKQLLELKRATLARMLCRAGYLKQVPQYAFLAPSPYNPLINCSSIPEINYSYF